LGCAVGLPLGFWWLPASHAQPFSWTRNNQTLGHAGFVQVMAQGVQSQSNTPPDPTPNDDFSGAPIQIERDPPVPGGVDGAGGAGAPGAGNGADGNPGASGRARAFTKTESMGELNPNNQAILNWSFIHNHTGALEMIGSGGGGGRGGGGGWVNPANPNNVITGGVANSGVAGVWATGGFTCTHSSTATVAATLQGPPGGTATASIHINIGWVRNVSPINPGQYFGSFTNFTVTAGAASAWVSGNTGGRVTITARDGNGNFVFRTSTSNLGDPTGSVALSGNDATATVAPGAQATIAANVFSAMTRGIAAGGGGGGGVAGSPGGQFPGGNGPNGADAPPPLGSLGGTGGSGGAGGGIGGAGGNGGDGGDGQGEPANYAYMFQGVVEVAVTTP
jgi:hypothetical protein